MTDATPLASEQITPNNTEDMIVVPRGLLAAAAYCARKHVGADSETYKAISAASLSPAASSVERLETEVAKWRHKLWMVACHALGGGMPDIKGIEQSTNDICVQISALRNKVYQAGKDAALSATPAPSDQDASQAQWEGRNPLSKIGWLTDGQPAPGATAQDGVEPFAEADAEVARIMALSDEEVLAEANVGDVAWARGFKQGLQMGRNATTPSPTIPAGMVADQVRSILFAAGVHEDADTAIGLIPYPVAARAVRDALAAAPKQAQQQGVDAAREALRRSREGWINAIEMEIIPDRHRKSAQILADDCHAALAALNAPTGAVEKGEVE